MHKNSLKKCWRQIDEATEAIERLMDHGIISKNYWDTFEDLVSIKNELEEDIEPHNNEGNRLRCTQCEDPLSKGVSNASLEADMCAECHTDMIEKMGWENQKRLIELQQREANRFRLSK